MGPRSPHCSAGVRAAFGLALACLLVLVSFIPGLVKAVSAHAQEEAPAGLFIPNAGQFPPAVRFQGHAAGQTLWLTRDAVWLSDPGQGVDVRLTFPGANPLAAVEPLDPLPGNVSYLLGNDPAGWQTALPVYGGARYRDLYDGVSLAILPAAGGLRLRFEARPGADLRAVRMQVEGAPVLAEGREILLAAPAAAASDALSGAWTTAEIFPSGATAGEYSLHWTGDAAARPTASGTLLYATYLGGALDDEAYAVAFDGSGARYVAGYTRSTDFPTRPGVHDRTFGGVRDAFAAKISPTGALAYATYLGGAASDWVFDLAVDAGGNVAVAGTTGSADFPLTANAVSRARNGATDAFVARLDAAGASLLYSTYLGGKVDDGAYALALGPGGILHVAGGTGSTDFPTTAAAYDRVYGGYRDAFVVGIDPAADTSLVYSTFLGGSALDEAEDLTVDASGGVVVAGVTQSAGFPTTPSAWDGSFNGVQDGFVARLKGNGSALLYATFVGGTGTDDANGVVLDAEGTIYAAGATASPSFPTTAGALNRMRRGTDDIWLAAFSADGASARYVTLFGGKGSDAAPRLAVSTDRQVYLTGRTTSTDLPITPDAADPTANGDTDAFLAVVAADGAQLAYGTYLGGTAPDAATDIKLDAAKRAYLVGSTASPNFPLTSNAADASQNGGLDAFLAVLRMPPHPVLLPLVLRQQPSLPAPVLEPIPAPDANPSYLVRWSAVASAQSYFLQRATDAAFGDAVNLYNGPATEFRTASAGIAIYYYRVAAGNGSTQSPWSAAQAVEVRWETEPNETSTQANGALRSGPFYYGYPETPKDYYYFDLPAPGTITVEIANHRAYGGQMSLWYDSTADPANRKVTCIATPDCSLSYNGAAGRYYVQVYTAGEFNSNTPYSVRVTLP